MRIFSNNIYGVRNMENSYTGDELEIKSTDEKLDILESIGDSKNFSKFNMELLKRLSQDEEDQVRAKVAELLVLSDSPFSEEILINLLEDVDELVRVNACDSLSVSSSHNVINLLKSIILKDKSSLVRGYAALSIGDIAISISYDNKELEAFFITALLKERVKWVKINFYKVLYLLGDESYLNLLIHELENKSYKCRSLTVNTLSELISSKNSELIIKALTERLEIEKTVAVRSAIKKTLQNFIDNNDLEK